MHGASHSLCSRKIGWSCAISLKTEMSSPMTARTICESFLYGSILTLETFVRDISGKSECRKFMGDSCCFGRESSAESADPICVGGCTGTQFTCSRCLLTLLLGLRDCTKLLPDSLYARYILLEAGYILLGSDLLPLSISHDLRQGYWFAFSACLWWLSDELVDSDSTMRIQHRSQSLGLWLCAILLRSFTIW